MNKIFEIINYLLRFRRIYAFKKELVIKKRNCLFNGLDSKQKHEIKSFWKKFGVNKFDIDWVDFYISNSGIYDKRYIPDDIYFSRIDSYYNDFIACKYIDDKNLYDLIFKDVNMPYTVARKVNGTYMDENYSILNEDEVLKECLNSNSNLIVKPSVGSIGGRGIRFWDQNENLESLKKALNVSSNLIIQKIVKQHKDLAILHPESLNTIRIVTLFHNNSVQFVSAVVRIGINGSRVDNVSSGGLACGIDSDGCLKEYAFWGNGSKTKVHPQGTVFKGRKIPSFDKCISMATSLAMRIVRFSRLVSWDFSVDEEGAPVFIEANMKVGGLDIHQMANGPLFGDKTEDILKEVFNKN